MPQSIPRTGSISAKELAEKVDADASLIGVFGTEHNDRDHSVLICCLIARLMRILTVTGIFDMVGPDEYAHTPYSLAYIEGHEVDFIKLWSVPLCYFRLGPNFISLTK